MSELSIRVTHRTEVDGKSIEKTIDIESIPETPPVQRIAPPPAYLKAAPPLFRRPVQPHDRIKIAADGTH